MSFPSVKYKSVEDSFESNIINSSPQDGKVITRKKFTKTRKKFVATLVPLDDVERDLLLAHYNECEMVLSFQWEHPTTINPLTSDKFFTVRYSEPLKITKDGKFKELNNVESIKLMEV